MKSKAHTFRLPWIGFADNGLRNSIDDCRYNVTK